MTADPVQEIKSRVDIIDVVAEHVRLQRSGRSHKGLCPFHSERTPSFHVDQERQAWYCFGCSEGGDVFTFVQRIDHLDFRQALHLLAERAGVEIEMAAGARENARRRRKSTELHAIAQKYYEYVLWSTESGAPGRSLLVARGVPEELARGFGVGFAPAGGQRGDSLAMYLLRRHGARPDELVEAGLVHPPRGGGLRDRFRDRLVFPIHDDRGHTIAFGGRAMADGGPKYLNTPATEVYDKSAALFGLDLARAAISAGGRAVLVEGYFDVLAAHRAGVPETVASSGTALTAHHVKLLGRLARVLVLCFDGDDAGRAATRKAVDLVATEGLECRICLLPEGVKDPDELARADPDGFRTLVDAAPREWQVLLDAALEDVESGSVDQRQEGARRAVELLARIPQATTRDLYAQQAAHRLNIDVGALTRDIEGRTAADRGRPAAVPARIQLAPPPVVDTAEEPPAALLPPPPPWEARLAAIALQRGATVGAQTALPEFAASLADPRVREILEVAAAGEDGLPLHRLSGAAQALAAGLLMRELPELADADPELLGRSIADCILRTREAAIARRIGVIRRDRQRARDNGQDDDAERLAVALHELVGERHRLRAVSGGTDPVM